MKITIILDYAKQFGVLRQKFHLQFKKEDKSERIERLVLRENLEIKEKLTVLSEWKIEFKLPIAST